MYVDLRVYAKKMNKKKKIILKEVLQIIGKALVVSLKIKSIYSYVAIVIGFIAAFFPIMIANLLSVLTELLVKLYEGSVSVSEPLRIFALIGGLFIAQAVNSFIQSYISQRDSIDVEEYLIETIIKITCRTDYKYIENYDEFRQKIELFEEKTGREVATSINIVIQWLQTLITFIVISVSLVSINVWIIIILIMTCVPAFILCFAQKDEEYRFKTKWMKEGSMVIHYYGMCCAPDSMNELRHWKIYDYIKAGWRDVANKYIKKKNNITKKHVIYNSIADFLRSSVYIVILILTARTIVLDPQIGLGTYMLVTSLTADYQRITIELFTQMGLFIQDIKYMQDFFEICEYSKSKKALPKEMVEEWDITVRDLEFTYPNSERKVLRGINLHLKEGEKIAIVGENGSGKSTLINLLCGLEEPDAGEILYVKIDLKDNVDFVRERISVAFQKYSRYEDTIRNNIIISMLDKEVDEKLFEEVCMKTGVDDIAKLQQNGYDEILGVFNEDGNNLSGGQWQKIVLARAAYKDNAKIMVLDEPTAALDPVAETKLYEKFADIIKDKTLILISHRLGICKLVDRIIVMKDGVIVEEGTHKALLNNNGYYAELYRSQAQWYK